MCSYARTCSYQGIDDLGAVSLHVRKIIRTIKVCDVINLPITLLGDAFISGPTTTKSMCVLSITSSIFFFTLIYQKIIIIITYVYIYTYQFNFVCVFGETVIREPQRFVKVINFSYVPNITLLKSKETT